MFAAPTTAGNPNSALQFVPQQSARPEPVEGLLVGEWFDKSDRVETLDKIGVHQELWFVAAQLVLSST